MEGSATSPGFENARPTYRDLLASPGAARVLAAQVVGTIADDMWTLAIVLIGLTTFNSPVLAGAAALCNQVGVLAAPAAGALVDRHGRRRLIVADYMISAAILATMAALLAGGRLPAAVFLALIVVASLTTQLSFVALRTILPQMLGSTMLDRANALTFMSRSAARTAAPAMVGALIAYGNGPLAIASTAALYGVGVVVVLGFRESVPGRVDATHIGVEIVEGLRHTWVNPVVRRVGVFTAVAFFGWGSLYGAVPVFIQHTLHGGPMLTGVTFAVFGLVGVATGLLSGRIATEGREGTVLFICAALAGVALLLIGLGQGMAAMFAGIVGLGIVETPVDQAAHGARQRYCSPAMLGRVTAVGTAVDIAACGLGIFVSAALAGMNPPATLAAFGVWVVCASMLGPWACTTTARRRALTMALNGRLAHPEPAARDR